MTLSAHDTLTPAEFYAELTTRNRGFVSPQTQAALARATILVAGCGSTGGAAVEPLVRLGAQHFLLAEPGTYELNNLNRQHASVSEIGRNKADVCAERVHAVNPWATTEVFDRGITEDNADDLVRRCTVVIDGVDVTERSGWLAKLRLHEAAAAIGRPVLTGYDMAGTQYVRFYDYAPGSRPFDGALTRAQVESATTWELLRRAVPLRFVPVAMLEQARRQVAATSTGAKHSDEGLPQLVHASWLFGSMSARMTLNVLEGTGVRKHSVVDADAVVSRGTTRLRRSARKPVVLALSLRDLARLKRQAA